MVVAADKWGRPSPVFWAGFADHDGFRRSSLGEGEAVKKIRVRKTLPPEQVVRGSGRVVRSLSGSDGFAVDEKVDCLIKGGPLAVPGSSLGSG